MYTEEEAKKKWCPMVRFHIVDNGAYHNKPLTDDYDQGYATKDSPHCIASECMMWRWINETGICGLASGGTF